jgi:hydroxysqualene synthase
MYEPAFGGVNADSQKAHGQSLAVSVEHYENFPVASLLCPPALRPAVTAIYHFARTADDIADEGSAPALERLAALERYEAALHEAAQGRSGDDWPQVFLPLSRQIARHRLPVALLSQLLAAFKQDTHNPIYPDRAALLDYCSRSADPIGRLLLHLAGVNDASALAQSDAICSSLQLINFWQDMSRDHPRGRFYVPVTDATRQGLDVPTLREDSDASRALVRELCDWARELMQRGAPLVHRMPGRFGWELRLVVQGGLRILDKIEARGFNALSHRPTVGAIDAPVLLWRALWMRRGTAAVLSDPAAR